MRLTNEEIAEFKRIYHNQVGEDISDERADELGWQLLELFRVICKPLPLGHRCRACTPEEHFDKSEEKTRMTVKE
jgi:hypothetical protein